MQVLTLRGSNVIEVTDREGVKSLALFPAKFQKSFWIKSGSFVVVDASGRDRHWNQGARLRVLSLKSSSTNKFGLCKSLVIGHLSSSQLPAKVLRREHKHKLPRLTRNQIPMKMTICHRSKKTPTGIDHLNCILTQTVVLILKQV
ncbi:hypothetical protein HU200_001686 [Digitaria exilis]|uniref:S1-like domain-containing protein n=1 Tax=Digitaria exilis TaxID=1010633 RepID=A0A835KUL2_9POAL|nr:hypothetical protein HU200_001686 [Digitaria exilis]